MDYLELYQQTRANIKPYLLDYVKSITPRSRNTNQFICPLCGSGTGKHKTGAFTVYKTNTYYCFQCGRYGDIIDLYKEMHGVNEKTAVKELSSLYGLYYPLAGDQTERPIQNTIPIPQKQEQAAKQPETDFTELYREAQAHITETDYPQKRGLSDETIKRYGLGFIEKWKHPKAARSPTSPRLIIPISNYSYIARDTRTYLTKDQELFKKQKVKGKECACWIFNSIALTAAEQPIFIVEGEIDCLSILEIGGVACGIGSTANIKQFLKACERHKPKQPLIICLDDDNAGKQAQTELAKGLESMKIQFYERNINGHYKDCNEYLKADRNSFTRAVHEIIAELKGVQEHDINTN